jgi:molybdopterin-guanine dinucleotide biosynthesis protein A
MIKQKITGIVLAGGESSRMGVDKSLLKWKGKTLTEHVIDTLNPLCNKVVISSNKKVYDFTGCETWPDEIAQQAPIIGIYSCLKRSETEINLVLSCDMPLITAELLKLLINSSHNYSLVVPVHDNGMIEPLCGVYKRTIIPVMEKCILDENLSMHKFLEACDTLYFKIDNESEFYSTQLFSNINTRDDLAKLSE